MKRFFLFAWGGIIWLSNTMPARAQNKTDQPQTYRNVCFYAIEKEGFITYMEAQKAVAEHDYKVLYPAIRQMRRDLQQFDPADIERSFEFWYSVNYTDFEQQLNAARNSTLAALDLYEERLRDGEAQYFDHRAFLNSYLAYTSEAFYKLFWFMSMERYFSNALIERVAQANPEGRSLFDSSEFYRPFPDFDALLKQEEEEMKRYLGIGDYGIDSAGIGDKPLIPYSFMVLDKAVAGYVLDNFKLDDATQHLEIDREIRYLKRFLNKARVGTIWLVIRLDGIPFGKTRN